MKVVAGRAGRASVQARRHGRAHCRLGSAAGYAAPRSQAQMRCVAWWDRSSHTALWGVSRAILQPAKAHQALPDRSKPRALTPKALAGWFPTCVGQTTTMPASREPQQRSPPVPLRTRHAARRPCARSSARIFACRFFSTSAWNLAHSSAPIRSAMRSVSAMVRRKAVSCSSVRRAVGSGDGIHSNGRPSNSASKIGVTKGAGRPKACLAVGGIRDAGEVSIWRSSYSSLE